MTLNASSLKINLELSSDFRTNKNKLITTFYKVHHRLTPHKQHRTQVWGGQQGALTLHTD